MLRLHCSAMIGAWIVLSIIPSAETTKLLPGADAACYAIDTNKYRDVFVKEKVTKYTNPSNSSYNKAFAEIMHRLDTSMETFYFSYDPQQDHGELIYDGTFLYINIWDPKEEYGTDDGAAGILFEEVKHAEQFLDGKTFFQRNGTGWISVSNLDIEVEAKVFVADVLPTHPTWKYRINANESRDVKTVLEYLKKAKSKEEQYKYLQKGDTIYGPRTELLNIPPLLIIKPTYPEGTTIPVNNTCPVRTKTTFKFCYPLKTD